MLHNSVPYEIITWDYADLLWINDLIRRLAKNKNEAYKPFKSSSNNSQHFKIFNAFRI